MRRNAAPMVSARRGLEALAVCATLIATPAIAGDRALIDIIGYSEDARYFAFEEFGIQDGSGFAYSTIYIVDLARDRWVGGTPIHVQSDDERVELAEIRDEARDEVEDLLEGYRFETPAQLIAHIGDGEFDADAQLLEFGLPGYTGPGSVMGEYRLELASFPAQSPQPCEDYLGERALGYELVLTQDGEDRVLHRDERLPQSRGCPTDYRLYGVALPFGAADLSGGVALISVYPFGFEGPDRRFVAVPLAQ